MSSFALSNLKLTENLENNGSIAFTECALFQRLECIAVQLSFGELELAIDNLPGKPKPCLCLSHLDSERTLCYVPWLLSRSLNSEWLVIVVCPEFTLSTAGCVRRCSGVVYNGATWRAECWNAMLQGYP